MQSWPDWWQYEIVISSHLIERMEDRGFSEIDVRAMFDDATQWRQSIVPGRFVITTAHQSEAWEIVVEPDELGGTLIVVTAYGLES